MLYSDDPLGLAVAKNSGHLALAMDAAEFRRVTADAAHVFSFG